MGCTFSLQTRALLRTIPPPSPVLPREVENLAYVALPAARDVNTLPRMQQARLPPLVRLHLCGHRNLRHPQPRGPGRAAEFRRVMLQFLRDRWRRPHLAELREQLHGPDLVEMQQRPGIGDKQPHCGGCGGLTSASAAAMSSI